VTASYESKRKLSGALQFRAVFEDAPTGMALLDLDGRVLRVNRALCRILRADQTYLLSGEFEGVIVPNKPDQENKHLSHLTAGRIPYFQE
jgi:PAS domain S-box-containing protein